MDYERVNHRLNNTKKLIDKPPRKKKRKDKIKCFKCHKMGHYASECVKNSEKKDKTNDNANMANFNRILVLKKKIVEVNGQKYKAIFDSGSHVNVISKKILQSL